MCPLSGDNWQTICQFALFHHHFILAHLWRVLTLFRPRNFHWLRLGMVWHVASPGLEAESKTQHHWLKNKLFDFIPFKFEQRSAFASVRLLIYDLSK